MSNAHRPASIAVTPENQRWRWTARAPLAALDGEAPNQHSAWKTASFAAGALEAFGRLGQRRF